MAVKGELVYVLEFEPTLVHGAPPVADLCHWYESDGVPPDAETVIVGVPPVQMSEPAGSARITGSATTVTVAYPVVSGPQPAPDCEMTAR